MTYLKGIVIALALMFASVRVDADVLPQVIIDWASTNVVKVHVGLGTSGTAWFITPTKLITACHVTGSWVTGNISPEGDSKMYPFKVLACNKQDDIALLELTGDLPNSVPTIIAMNTPELGQATYGAGYPTALPQIVTHGHWQRQAGPILEGSYVDLGHALGGDSGGPIMVLEQGVVTVVTLREGVYKTSNDQTHENITFVVDPEKLRKFLNENN